jgi:nitrite reductase/ring-hydroxylating ferredoxin subunit
VSKPTCPFEGACGATSRRAFLQQGAGALVEVLVVFGLTSVWTQTGRAVGNERAYPIPPADGVTLDRDAQLLLVRYQGKVFALALTCPHQNAAVRWLPQDGRFQCTRHDSKYQPDGTYTSGRATRNMDRLPIRRDGVNVLVDVSQIIRADQNAAAWNAAVVAVV